MEHATQQTAAMQPSNTLAPDPSELTDAELAFVVGGTEGPGNPTDGTGRHSM
jgi:hypothetical protein